MLMIRKRRLHLSYVAFSVRVGHEQRQEQWERTCRDGASSYTGSGYSVAKVD